MSDIFNCSKDFLKSIYGEKYCRRVCSEVEITSILTLLWLSLESAGVTHEFREKEELYQYLRETFKIKAPDQMYSDDNKSEVSLPDFEDEIVKDLKQELADPCPSLDTVTEAHKETVTEVAGDTVTEASLETITETVTETTTETVTEIAVETIKEAVIEAVVDTVTEAVIEEAVEVEITDNSPFVKIEYIVEPFKSKKDYSDSEDRKKRRKVKKKHAKVERTEGSEKSETMSNSNSPSPSLYEEVVEGPEGQESLEGPKGQEDDDDDEIEEPMHPRIAELLAIPQPEQKSLAWLSQRQDYITASVFGASTGLLGPAALTTLLLDKISKGKLNPFGGNQATHWGEKYEPISNDLYVYRMRSKTYEFGMIAHPSKEIGFLGASTDGIAVYKGKLTNIEIKSPFSRHITGIPKPEYWAQMQLQMEILDLNDTHFIESKFREYESLDEFWKIFDLTLDEIDNPTSLQGAQGIQGIQDANIDASRDNLSRSSEAYTNSVREYDAEGEPLALSYYDTLHLEKMSWSRKSNKNQEAKKQERKYSPLSDLQGDQVTPLRNLKKEERGIMIEAISLDKQENDGSPKRIYISSPIKLYKDEKGLRKWYENQLKEFQTSQTMVFLKSNGWVVERFSCVYVERDRIWFKNQISTVQNFWSDVVHYRNENLSLDQIAKLKEPLNNKYRSIIATNTALNTQKPKNVAGFSKKTRTYAKKSTGGGGFGTGDDDDELPIGILGGCMLDGFNDGSSTSTSTSTPNIGVNTGTKIKVGSSAAVSNSNSGSSGNASSGFGGFGRLGFGCLLSDDSKTALSTPIATPSATPITTPITTPVVKKKLAPSGNKKFF